MVLFFPLFEESMLYTELFFTLIAFFGAQVRIIHVENIKLFELGFIMDDAFFQSKLLITLVNFIYSIVPSVLLALKLT